MGISNIHLVLLTFVAFSCSFCKCVNDVPEGYIDVPDELGKSRGTVFIDAGSNAGERELTKDEELALRFLISPQFLRHVEGPYAAGLKGWPICTIDGQTYELVGTSMVIKRPGAGQGWRWSAEGAHWILDEVTQDNLDLTPLVDWYKKEKGLK